MNLQLRLSVTAGSRGIVPAEIKQVPGNDDDELYSIRHWADVSPGKLYTDDEAVFSLFLCLIFKYFFL